MKIERAKEALKCAGANIKSLQENANGYQHVQLKCQKCDDLPFCMRVTNMVEYVVNGGK